jgi:hypothetical protein
MEDNVPDDKKPVDITPDIQAEIDRLAEEKLKKIKESLDKAYELRDAEKKRADTLESEKRAIEIKALEEAGKHKEALEAQLADERAAKKRLEDELVVLTRDSQIKAALSAGSFKNTTASSFAFRAVLETLVADANGVWKSKSGKSIEEAAAEFLADPKNEFLLEPKVNSGTGSSGSRKKDDSVGDGGSLFAKSTADVLKMAASGQLANRRQRRR